MHPHHIQLFIQIAGLLVSIVGLVYLVKYVRATKGIEKASNEQSEGLSKPVITVKLEPTPDDRAYLENVSTQIHGDKVSLINIGTGPALSLQWKIKVTDQEHPTLLFPYLKVNEDISTGTNVSSLRGSENWTVECTYESVSGARYSSATHFFRDFAVGFSFKRSGH